MEGTSLELANRGINVTAVDNLPDYINEIKEKAATKSLPVESICTDVLEMQIDQEFDAVICMGNSLQFFNEEDSMRITFKYICSPETRRKVFYQYLVHCRNCGEEF